ncbi:hypothetical protein [Actinokineospora terrae]|uniref:hypothetical protein n=1 Tax=Actinokineospora terrae TaxID=155974 RepID=UPI001C432494|nr:hypothetical protein [Actinokineospora terrae]
MSVIDTATNTETGTITGHPVPGQTITFTVGSTTVCTAATNASGVATCHGPCPVLVALLAGHYTATFAGSATLAPATARGNLIQHH